MPGLLTRVSALERHRSGPCLACALARLPVVAVPGDAVRDAALAAPAGPCTHPAGIGLVDMIEAAK